MPLRALYPEVKTQLDHRKPFEFLFATVLSAQRTDKQVNKIKSDLFQRLKILQDFVRIAFKDLEDIIVEGPQGISGTSLEHAG